MFQTDWEQADTFAVQKDRLSCRVIAASTSEKLSLTNERSNFIGVGKLVWLSYGQH